MRSAPGVERLDMHHISAEHRAPLGLIELVAPRRVVEEVAEVREQIEIGVDAEQLHVLNRVSADAMPGSRKAIALRAAAIGRVDGAESREQTTVDCTSRNLVGRVP